MSRGPTRRGVLGLVAAGALAGCAGGGAAYGRMRLAGGEPGGTFIKVSRLLAGELVDQGVVDGVRVVLSGGSVENLQLLADGDVLMAPALADAVSTSGLPGVVAVSRVYQHALHCLVAAGSPVRSLDQLDGRRVSIGIAGSGTAATARRMLEVAGASPPAGEDWLAQGTADSAVSVAGGAVDAMFWWGGSPAPEIASVAAVRPLRALDLGELIGPANALAAQVYQAVRLPGGMYGQDDVRTVGAAAHLVCRADLDDDLVAGIVGVLARSGRRLVPQPADGVQYYAPSTLFDTSPIPLHPAAVRRLRALHG